MSKPDVSVTQTIEQRKLGRAQYAIIVLCALVALLDGMDLQSIGLAAPLMAEALHVAPPKFGLVFSAALLGMAFGSFAFGRLADVYGRKRVLIAATLGFGVFTICTALAGDFAELLACRFLTGVGLGGATPCFISLCSEYVPRRMRATVVSLVWAGFPLGGVVGGLLASRLIPAFGWRSVFLAGGAPAVLIVVALAWALPESLEYLVRSAAAPQHIAAILQRLFPKTPFSANSNFSMAESARAAARSRDLFALDPAAPTVLLWTSFFFAFMILVTNSAWSPTLLRAEGMGIERSALALAAFNFGSLIGSSLAGWLLTRFGSVAVLPGALAGSAVAYTLVGYAAPSVAAVTICQGLFGLFAGCASSGLIAFAATLYPAALRATGVGYAMAVGRCGSVLGPLVVGQLVGAHLSIRSVFSIMGGMVLLGTLSALVLGLRRPPRDRAVAQ